LKKALLIVDVQNDFCPGGALAVKGGDLIIPTINRLSQEFEIVVLAQDWHPSHHLSFASSYPDKRPYESVNMEYGMQVLWPDHCVQNTKGAEFHKDLDVSNAQLIIRKGFRKHIDSYSAFYENDRKTATGLSGFLKGLDVDSLYITGLATDFCVKWSAIDGVKEGFNVFVVEDAVEGIDINQSVELAWKEMKAEGVEIIKSANVLNQLAAGV